MTTKWYYIDGSFGYIRCASDGRMLKNSFNKVKSAAQSGMNGVRSAVQNGMNGAVSVASSAGNRMVSIMRSTSSGMRSAGYYAGIGFTNGLSSSAGSLTR